MYEEKNVVQVRHGYRPLQDFKQCEDILSKKQSSPAVFIMTASWLGNGLFVDRWVAQRAKDLMGRIAFYRIDVDQLPRTREFFRVTGLPAGYFIKNGEIQDHFSGMIGRAVFDRKVDGLLAD